MIQRFLVALSPTQARPSLASRQESRSVGIGLAVSVAGFQAKLASDSRHFAEAAMILEIAAEQPAVSLTALLALLAGIAVAIRTSPTAL
jgi:hypothetical protein